jgi:hypothetical protein
MNASPVSAHRRAWCLRACSAGLTLLLGAHWPRRAAANDGLEGRRFDTQAGLVGKPAHVPSDILSFAGGLFHSSDCDQYEYGKGRYKSSTEPDGSIRFEAETESPSYGRNLWKGRVRGRAVEGEFIFLRKPTWWRPNPDPLPHWFKGHEIDAGGKPLT